MAAFGLAFIVIGVGLFISARTDPNKLSRMRTVDLAVALTGFGIWQTARPLFPEDVNTGLLGVLLILFLAQYIWTIRQHARRAAKEDPEWLAKRRAFKGQFIVVAIPVAVSAIGYLADVDVLKLLWVPGVIFIALFSWEELMFRGQQPPKA